MVQAASPNNRASSCISRVARSNHVFGIKMAALRILYDKNNLGKFALDSFGE
jgi:hypothetical protein